MNRQRTEAMHQTPPFSIGVLCIALLKLVAISSAYNLQSRRWTSQTWPSVSTRNNEPSLRRPTPILKIRYQSRIAPIFATSDNQDFEFKEFDIDDILSEAEDALKTAENSLETKDGSGVIPQPTTMKSTSAKTTTTISSPPSIPSPPRPTIALDAEQFKNTVASTMGGVLVGSIFGSIATFQFPDLASALDDSSSIFILPILGAVSLGIVGAIGGGQNNALGTITRGILGAPILLLVSAMQSSAARQVEKTTNEIKALPQNLANAAQQRVQSTVESAVEEVTSLPGKARDKVVDNVKSSVNSAVEEVTSIPRKAVENVKSLPQKARDSVMDSGVTSKESLLALVLVPTLLALAFLLVDAFATGRLSGPSI